MRDLSMHIMDLVENSIRAGARNVGIGIAEDAAAGTLTLTVTDDGAGMTEDELRRALKPFYTTKTVGSVGLGLPLMRQTAEQSGGGLEVRSAPGTGTTVSATMMLNHIDRPPMGDLNETLRALIGANPEIDFDVSFITDGKEERFSTRAEASGK